MSLAAKGFLPFWRIKLVRTEEATWTREETYSVYWSKSQMLPLIGHWQLPCPGWLITFISILCRCLAAVHLFRPVFDSVRFQCTRRCAYIRELQSTKAWLCSNTPEWSRWFILPVSIADAPEGYTSVQLQQRPAFICMVTLRQKPEGSHSVCFHLVLHVQFALEHVWSMDLAYVFKPSCANWTGSL